MTAYVTRSNIVALKEETTEGTLPTIVAGDFVHIREGGTFGNELQTIASDEVKNSLEAGKEIVVGTEPKMSLNFHMKHSGVENTEPEYGVAFESLFGSKAVTTGEHVVDVGATTSVVPVTASGDEHPAGTPLLIKDGTNGYSVRWVRDRSTNDLTLNFQTSAAATAASTVGRHITYVPASTGHPSFSGVRHQAESSAAFKDAMTGVKSTAIAMEFPAKGLATATLEATGVNYYFDYYVITDSNRYLDVTDDGGTFVVTLGTVGVDQTFAFPQDLATEIQTKVAAACLASGGDDFTCTYSNSAGTFTLATSTGTTLEFLWKSGSKGADNADTFIDVIGFDGSADSTGATSYTGSAANYDPAVSPEFDTADPLVVKSSELLIGTGDETSDSITCVPASSVSINVGAETQDVNTICATSGKDSVIASGREITLSANIILSKYDASIFYNAVNNNTQQIQFTTGEKTGTNWDAGKIFTFWMENCSITGSTIQDENSYTIIAFEAKGFAGGSGQNGGVMAFL